MPTIYVANFCTANEHDAEKDDPSARDMSLADFAAPQVAGVHRPFAEGQLPSAGFIAKMREAVETDVLEELGYAIEEEGTEVRFEWTMSGWQTPENGRPHNVYTLKALDTVWAVMVIQQMELS